MDLVYPFSPDTPQEEDSTVRYAQYGVQIGPIELETARRHLGGMPCRATVSFFFLLGADSYAARRLLNP